MSKRSFQEKSFDRDRTNVFIYIFVTLFLIIEIRLFTIQVLGHQKYEKLAYNQHWTQQEISSSRGSVYTDDGYLLAGTQYSYLMYGEPNKFGNKDETAQVLAKIMADIKLNPSISNLNKSKDLPNTKEELLSYYYDKYFHLIDRDLMWVGLEKSLTPLEKEEIEKHNIVGIGFEETPLRYYPEGSLGSHILGFVASNESGEEQGYFGIEGKFNEDLKGKTGKLVQETDALGNPILAGGYKKDDSLSGRDIVLTINRTVQYFVEQKLKEGVEKYGAVSGTVIVMDPATGKILSLANYPTYSSGDFSLPKNDYEEDANYRKVLEKRNLAISQTYEPGSVMKPFTISAAIDSGLMTPYTTFEDNGPVWYYEYKIDNWNGQHYGTQTLIQLLQKSNNIGAAWVGHQLGAKKLHDYLADFGIGSLTGIELEGEDTGLMRDYTEWTDIGLANISFGQGISATPLQVLNAFNAVVNGGYLVEPKIINKVIDRENNITLDIPTKLVRRVISEETSKTLVDMLEQAASGGEAQYFVLKQYKIAGKTGTAQIPVGDAYDPSKTNATFIGYLLGSKKFSMIVRLEEPHSSIYAAETAVPLWMDIAAELVKYYGVAPDRF